MPSAPLDADGHRVTFDRGIRLTSEREGTLPLLLLERQAPVEEGTLPVLHLLGAIDEVLRHVVVGPLVILQGPRWQAQWHPDGGSSRRRPDHDMVMDRCRRLAPGADVRLPRHTRTFVGQSWLG